MDRLEAMRVLLAVQRNAADTSVPINPRLIVSTVEAAIDAAVEGLGVTSVLSYQVESALRAGASRRLQDH